MEEKSLAVYIITYNRAEYLKQTIESVLNQTMTEFSLYVLDNCSNDNTNEIVSCFSDCRLHYIRHEKNIKASGNINYAINHCKEDFMVIFHDDDIMLPDFLKREYEIISADDSIDVVSCNAIYIDEEGKPGIIAKKINKTEIYSSGQLLMQYLKHGRSLIFPSIMYRTKFLQEHNIYLLPEVGPCADVVLYFNIEKMGGKIYELPDGLIQYRFHKGQDTERYMFTMHETLFKYMFSDEYFLKKINNNNKIYKSINNKLTKLAIIEFILGNTSYFESQKRIDFIYELTGYKSKTVFKFILRIVYLFPQKCREIFIKYREKKY